MLDAYVTEQCDCLVIETNKAGHYPTQNVRAAARERGWSVVELGKDERPRHVPKIIYVREVYARGEKADRARPLSTAYERGQISHVEGVDFTDLEDILTTWIPTPGARSPDRLDAHVHAIVELLGLDSNKPDPRGGFQGIEQAAKVLSQSHRQSPVIPNGGGWGGWGGSRI